MTAETFDVSALPPASKHQGGPGHDQATGLARGIQLLDARIQGMTYDQMAQQFGYADASGARHALIRALNRHEADRVDEARAIENAKADRDELEVRNVINAARRANDHATVLRAIDTRTRIAARRARLNGWDAPVKVQVSAGVEAKVADAFSELEAALDDLAAGPVVAGEVTAVRTGTGTGDPADPDA